MNSLESAGGIGGLLAVQDAGASQDYVYFHDALGSVGQVLDLAAQTAGAAMVAKYEYDPYGNQTGVAGGYEQPFRFSGKYHDAETGLGYWGYRYYNPVLGRWLNRDPLGEPGGLNLYAYCGNGPAGRIDALGLSGDETPECGGSGTPSPGAGCDPAMCCDIKEVRRITSIKVIVMQTSGICPPERSIRKAAEEEITKSRPEDPGKAWTFAQQCKGCNCENIQQFDGRRTIVDVRTDTFCWGWTKEEGDWVYKLGRVSCDGRPGERKCTAKTQVTVVLDGKGEVGSCIRGSSTPGIPR
jgi:RHS repeat-associated protein